MNPRKILLVTYHFPPSAASGSFRLLGFARHLPKFGWNTAVVAPPDLPWEPVDPKLAKQIPAETTVYPAPYPRHWPKLVRWAAPYAVWLAAARKVCRQAVEAEKPDVVLTSGPPHWVHLLGLHLQNRYQLPWVADFRDPWMRGLDVPRRGWWQRHWENRVLRRADMILANAPYACRQVQEAFPGAAQKIRSLTNGFDPREAEDSQPCRAGPLRVVHAGQIYSGRDPRPFLDAVQQLTVANATPAFTMCFLGRTTGHGVNVAEEVVQRGLEQRVEVADQVTYAQSLDEMRRADILLLLDNPGRRVGVPAKLYEYFGASRAVLALAEPDGDTACVLRDSGLLHGLARPDDAGAIAEQLVRLLHTVQEQRGEPAATDAAQRFTREHLAGTLGQWLDELVGDAPLRAEVECLVGTSER